MQLNLRHLLLNNTTLKISSVIIGCLLWSILNESYRAHLTLAIPVYFYNVPEQLSLSAAEQLCVTLAAKPADIRNLDQEDLAAHIDAQEFTHGDNAVNVTAQNLLLPAQVSLVKYKPIQQNS
jgi:hypothetical protein